MKTALKIIASVLLLFNSIAAIFGGGNLIDRPDGSNLGLTLDWLKHTPFHDYLVPGIILFAVNGVLGFAVLIAIYFDFRKYAQLIISQGVLLSGWIVVQVIMIRTIIGLHIVMFFVGFALCLSGGALNIMELSDVKRKKKAVANRSVRYLNSR